MSRVVEVPVWGVLVCESTYKLTSCAGGQERTSADCPCATLVSDSDEGAIVVALTLVLKVVQ